MGKMKIPITFTSNCRENLLTEDDTEENVRVATYILCANLKLGRCASLETRRAFQDTGDLIFNHILSFLGKVIDNPFHMDEDDKIIIKKIKKKREKISKEKEEEKRLLNSLAFENRISKKERRKLKKEIDQWYDSQEKYLIDQYDYYDDEILNDNYHHLKNLQQYDVDYY